MKTFFNVLYRRILYKIPLKFLLILLAIVSVFIACFSHADFIVDNTNYLDYSCPRAWADYSISVSSNSVVCLLNTLNSAVVSLSWATISPYIVGCYFNSWSTSLDLLIHCYSISNAVWSFRSFVFENVYSTMTSLDCQSEYNLIPISSVDQSYCENNNLCPSWWWSCNCPSGWVSNLFINDIFHPWAFNVVINIPEEIDRDYAYTSSWQNFNLDVVWYNVDYTKVQDQIDIQSFKPSDEDLSIIVSQVLPLFIPWLVIILFLYFIFKFIRKIF